MRKRVFAAVIMAIFVLVVTAVSAFAAKATVPGQPNPWPPTVSGSSLVSDMQCTSIGGLCAIYTNISGLLTIDCGTSGQSGNTQYTCTGVSRITCTGGKTFSRTAPPATNCNTVCGVCQSGWLNYPWPPAWTGLLITMTDDTSTNRCALFTATLGGMKVSCLNGIQEVDYNCTAVSGNQVCSSSGHTTVTVSGSDSYASKCHQVCGSITGRPYQ